LIDAIETNRFKLSGTVQDASELLGDLFEEITFVIIDGLDEMPERERGLLSRHLVTLLKENPNLRLLISSRSEKDILEIIEPHSEIVQAHSHNQHDICTYVKKRSESWLQTLNLEGNITAEIRQLLRPIAGKAEGS
jgi:hypothetical protein